MVLKREKMDNSIVFLGYVSVVDAHSCDQIYIYIVYYIHLQIIRILPRSKYILQQFSLPLGEAPRGTWGGGAVEETQVSTSMIDSSCYIMAMLVL